MPSKIDEFIQLFDYGFELTPLDGKKPVRTGWPAFQSSSDVEAYYRDHPQHNAGMLMGAKHGNFFAIDIDRHSTDGFDSLRQWEQGHGSLPETATSETGGGGRHLIYRTPVGVAVGCPRGVLPGVDIRGDGSLIAAPGSIHPVTGLPYNWLISPDMVPVAEATESVLALATRKRTPLPLQLPRNAIPEGQRHDVLFSLACSMRARALGEDATLAALTTENKNRCLPPLEATEVTKLVHDVFGRYPSGLSEGYRHSDMKAVEKARAAIEQPIEALAQSMSALDNGSRRPVIIEGLLRKGGKMEIQGPPKFGKSTLAMDLLTALANGLPWQGRQCLKSQCLYVNTELEPDEYTATFSDILAANDDGRSLDDIFILDLHGKSAPLDLLADSLIEKCQELEQVDVILIDPIYPIITGDENSAKDMTYFMNILDRIRNEVGCSIIFVHHHSKGSQQYSASMNRSSGSSVFSRSPTCILDLSPISVKDDIRDARQNKEQCQFISDYLDAHGLDLDIDTNTPDDATLYRAVCEKHLDAAILNELKEGLAIVEERVRHSKACRFDATLRGFSEPEPWNAWFDYPLHIPDIDGYLSHSKNASGKVADSSIKTERQQKKKVALLDEAVKKCREDGVEATRANVAERIGPLDGKAVTESMILEWTRARATWSPWRVGAANCLCRVEVN